MNNRDCGFNITTGRRNYFENVIWYSSVVYEANKKILSVSYGKNTKGYYKLLKEPLPEHYELISQEYIDILAIKYNGIKNGNGYTYQKGDNPNDFNSDYGTIRKIVVNQVAEITYVLNDGTHTDDNGDKITTKFVPIYNYMYKKSRFSKTADLATTPKVRNDFYNDDMMVNADNNEKFPCPNGSFFCKILSSFSNDTQDAQEILHFHTNKVQIETQDYIEGIKKDDWVLFRNEWWIIDAVQQSIFSKSQQYRTFEDKATVISLRR